MLLFGAKSLKEEIYAWNLQFPIDRWFRSQHQLTFNSIEHKNACFIDMYLEYLEFYYFSVKPEKQKRIEQKKKRAISKHIETEYEKGQGNFMKDIVWTQNDIDKVFDELDIDNL